MFNKYVDGHEKKIMKKKGFKYDRKLKKFIFDGYGTYIKDISSELVDEYVRVFKKLGYDIVSGPKGDSVDDNLVGIYYKNYSSVLGHKEILRQDIAGLSDTIITACCLEKNLVDDGYLKDFVGYEIDSLLIVAGELDLNSFYEIVGYLDEVCKDMNDISHPLVAVSKTLTSNLCRKIVTITDNDVDKEKVEALVADTKRFAMLARERAHDVIMHRQTSAKPPEFLLDYFKFLIDIKENCTTAEIRALLNEVDTKIFGRHIECANAFDDLKECIVEKKVIDEFFNKAKIKNKK